jgi:hypothetical protein
VGERTFTKCFPNVYIITGTESFEAANFFRLPASTTITYTVILRSQVFFMLIKSNDTTHLYSHCKITVTESGHAYVGNYWSRVQHRTGVPCLSVADHIYSSTLDPGHCRAQETPQWKNGAVPGAFPERTCVGGSAKGVAVLMRAAVGARTTRRRRRSPLPRDRARAGQLARSSMCDRAKETVTLLLRR